MRKILSRMGTAVRGFGFKQWFMTALIAALLLASAASLIGLGVVRRALVSVTAAERFRGGTDVRFAQIGCFLPVGQGKTEEDIFKFRQTLDSKLVEQSLEAPENGSLYLDAYSGSASVTVKSEGGGSASVKAVGVGGDFFYFHPLQLRSGSYIRSGDIMDDLVVLDEETGLPVWFQTIPGNVLDLSTISGVMEDVAESLGIRIGSLVLDAGYVTKSVIGEFNADPCQPAGAEGDRKPRTIVARMPAKKGYPHRKLYNETRHLYPNAKYEFIRKSHTYFGTVREITLFGFRMYAYVYVDKDNALTLGRKDREKDEDAYQRLTMAEKNWHSVKYGYFVLLSNTRAEPPQMLDEYFGRTSIETVFKTGKDFLSLLPLSKWSMQTVLGKLLSDTICTIVYLELLKALKGKEISMPKLLGTTSSLMCLRKADGTICVETPNKGTKEVYSKVGIKIPSSISLDDICKKLGLK